MEKIFTIFDGHKNHLSLEADEFCIHNDIELICLPPHSSHRLQPLDTRQNKLIKQKWSETLAKQLSDGSSVSLPRDRFYLILNSVWEEMPLKRGLILSAFAYFGPYLLRITVKKHEYKNREAFRNNDELQQGNVNFLLLRKIIPSPKRFQIQLTQNLIPQT